MPQTFVIDQAASFAAVAFLSAEPKTAFGSQVQDKTADGTPKWSVELIAAFRDNFGKVNNEVLRVGIASHRNPAEGLAMYTPVQLVNLVVGVMDKTIKDKATGETKVVGAQVWYRCDEVRPLAAVPVARKEG